ncbi:MAG: formylglycine-generating enzyme family protein, partial [Nostoc sp.]
VFLIKLNIRTKGNYRSPTEAEWEYAAGGGNSLGSRFGNGQYLLNPAQANFNATALHSYLYSIAGEYRQKTTRVGSFNPNNLGLYDLCGNVW